MVGPLASTPPSTNALQINHSHPTTSHHRLVCMSTPQLPRHDTFQSDDTFSLSLYVRDLDPADVAVAFRERAVCLATGPKPVSFFHAAFDAARWFLDADSLAHMRLFLTYSFSHHVAGQADFARRGVRDWPACARDCSGRVDVPRVQAQDRTQLAQEARRRPVEPLSGRGGRDPCILVFLSLELSRSCV